MGLEPSNKLHAEKPWKNPDDNSNIEEEHNRIL